jgi:hypothetical protein
MVVKPRRAKFLIEQLEELKLKVEKFESNVDAAFWDSSFWTHIFSSINCFSKKKTDEPSSLLAIYFPDDIMDREAELLKMDVQLKEHSQTAPFKVLAADMFEAFPAR